LKPVKLFGELFGPQLDLVISARTKFCEGLESVMVNVTSLDVEPPVLIEVAAVVASAAVIDTVGAEVSEVTQNFDTASFALPAASVNTLAANETQISLPSAALHLSRYTNGAGAGAFVASHAGELQPLAVTSPSMKSEAASLSVKLNVIAGEAAFAVAAPFVRVVPAPSAAVIVTVGFTMSDLMSTAVALCCQCPPCL